MPRTSTKQQAPPAPPTQAELDARLKRDLHMVNRGKALDAALKQALTASGVLPYLRPDYEEYGLFTRTFDEGAPHIGGRPYCQTDISLQMDAGNENVSLRVKTIEAYGDHKTPCVEVSASSTSRDTTRLLVFIDMLQKATLFGALWERLASPIEKRLPANLPEDN